MNDQLQEPTEQPEAAEVDENTEDQTADEQPDGEVSDSASEEEKVVFDERQQAKVNDLIGQKVKATRTVERENAELQRQLAETQAKIPQQERPNIPDLPDPFDDGFDTKLKEREAAVVKQAEFDANKRAQEASDERQNQQVMQQQQAKLTEVITTYAGRAKGLGISNDELKIAGDTLQQQGISGDLTVHILQDEKGPAITTFLANNPLALDEMRGMNSMQAAVHIETKIKPKVGGRKATTAPSPAETLNGGGTPPSERGPKGATFS